MDASKKPENLYCTEPTDFHACCFDFLSIVSDNVISGFNTKYEPRLDAYIPYFKSAVNKMTWRFLIKAKS